MFDSLEDKIKQDDSVEISRKERIVKGVVITVLSIVLFGGLYFAVRMVGT
ncbi:MAG: hypothetical protein JST11_07710 [Acidobacteria bacterium]|nr:hypothetical protein [Acidobacteriota bacterium]